MTLDFKLRKCSLYFKMAYNPYRDPDHLSSPIISKHSDPSYQTSLGDIVPVLKQIAEDIKEIKTAQQKDEYRKLCKDLSKDYQEIFATLGKISSTIKSLERSRTQIRYLTYFGLALVPITLVELAYGLSFLFA